MPGVRKRRDFPGWEHPHQFKAMGLPIEWPPLVPTPEPELRDTIIFNTIVVPGPGADCDPFAPTDLGGLKTWLVADDLDALWADEDNIDAWYSRSPATNNFTQSNATFRPDFKSAIKNGHDVVRFDGLNHRLEGGDQSASFPSAATLFIAASVADTRYALYEHHDRDNWFVFDGAGYHGAFRTSRVANTPSSGEPSSGWHYWTIQSSAAGFTVRRNGTQIVSAAAGFEGGTNHRIAVHTFTFEDKAVCDIAEILIYDTALSSANVAAVEAYLVDKYAL